MAGIEGANVARLRELVGISAKDLAKELGISTQYLCDIEQGRRTLKRNPALVKKIAVAFGVSLTMVEKRCDTAA